ncbi:hypothetical protein GCM10009654_13300 [Streptomyces hebeiensis]|uniref:Uncharacterized protein n=1 Tax=Streptomyces hebeiensis TaxID=229486 RepID=A0ABN1UPS5_9ACTN
MSSQANSTGGEAEKDDMLPGQPWPGQPEEPKPDSGPPPGDGAHRKER